jgi:hypothetical protein
MSPQAFSDLEPISKAAKRLRKHPRTLMRWTEKARRPAIHPAWVRSVSPYSDNRRLDRSQDEAAQSDALAATGNSGVEAFDVNERSLGIFSDAKAAADAVMSASAA